MTVFLVCRYPAGAWGGRVGEQRGREGTREREREREREYREKKIERGQGCEFVCVCVCVCRGEEGKGRERELCASVTYCCLSVFPRDPDSYLDPRP